MLDEKVDYYPDYSISSAGYDYELNVYLGGASFYTKYDASVNLLAIYP